MNKYITTSFFVLGGLMVNAQTKKTDTLSSKDKEIEQVELFGERNKKPQGLEVITRLPLKTRDQIQSISVISYKAIETLGGLSLIDVVKNVPGVTLFSSYGGGSESMSIRGYRGVPVLKNGVLLDSDFRTAGMITDMQGVESIQVIKGSAAVTQGIGDGLGAAGGVINVVTKRPQFVNRTNVGFRYGSWDFYRPTVDFQRVLDNEGKVAIRFNGAYQKNNSFRSHVQGERIYVNPSITFRPDKMTNITVEMDYMNDRRTPDRGTVNLAAGDTEALYTMPKGKFLGFAEDRAKTETYNFMTSVDRKINDKFKVRAAFINSVSNTDTQAMSIAPNGKNWNERKRSYGKNMGEDVNKVFQFDFIGQDVQTGFIKHTFQVGFDWKETTVTTTSFDVYKNAGDLNQKKPVNTNNPIDVINVLGDISNTLPYNLIFNKTATGIVKTPTMGLMAQDVMAFGRYVKAHLGVRYSRLNGSTKNDVSTWNPSFGLIISPLENVNVFGSYTTTTSLRSANNILQSGGFVGPSKTAQWEGGIKSDWFNEKLRFNVTLFDIKTDNLAYQILDSNYNPVRDPNNNPLYGLAGNLRRKGIEVELIGRILPNLQIMSGWAYLDAQYKDSPAYVNGSAPMNSPKHTANAWLNYRFNQGILDGLDVGAGIYYVGKRPVDEWTQKTFTAGHVNSVQPGVRPFDMPEYTTVDAQVGYALKNGVGVRVFFNNIFDRVGYSSYFRGGYIDQIQPRNFAVQLNYKF
ncbi:TonB-dependent siderophore receptor [Elizabethkingia anophelis]|uniref:TonB-dependent siderophore receptor n=1 Tax=Elizabethkingia anophelis TaxID=1117645 RepID=UPI0009992927|nr:TonB-dependent siderophore receptor [Elizabethkingia anophelis]MCT3719751.1 TonB-dependent siderophore receptor [Elizabethkingia anophelis]MCT3723261.1 TonB-dependent siderophore receptor [Elizabethkingia anophelis]MCT3755135.1 TonB-dependent siderophore receptor [Elizabethkingia anophelis]MCT3776399.1 TonB-dependent siderophore receptor [Elizabethkingia anophelis]MCT3783512.1 TonB-dependent siderophore receptor [Elizabethkingia anophelis]